MAKNILILGGSGFIGKTLSPTLLQKGYEVTLLNRGRHPITGTTQIIADRDSEESMTQACQSLPDFD